MLVIKIGGTEGVNFDAVMADVAAHVRAGQRLIVVHGGSGQTNAISTQLGHPPQMVTSPSGFTSRYTDRQTLEIFAMETTGKISTLITERLQKLGVNAFSLSGVDGRLMMARRKEAIRIIDPATGKQRMLRDDYTGKIESVDGGLLRRSMMMVLGACLALGRGGGRGVFADGRVDQPVAKALAGAGTVIS